MTGNFFIAITVLIRNLIRINRTLVFYFQSRFDFKKLIAITIAIENRSQINQTLIFIFQSNLD